MGINTPLGDDLDTYLTRLLEGRSAITRWTFFDDPRVYSKVGGDLSRYDLDAKLSTLGAKLPEPTFGRLKKIWRKAPFSTRISLASSADAWLDAGFDLGGDPYRSAVVVAGHNLNENYLYQNFKTFEEEPDYIDSLAALSMLDTDHAGAIGESLGFRGALYTTGGACASGNVGLRHCLDEIRHHGHDVAVLTGALFDYSPLALHAMALMGAITIESFNDAPEEASRPWDWSREGFVPSHGAATLVLEEMEHAKRRGARIYAEVLGCVATSDGNHLPSPSTEGQTETIARLLALTGVAKEEVDFVSAHATSTPVGDLSEIEAIRRAFGSHAKRLKINAPKSMLGHTCWSAPVVETVAAILQMRAGRLHQSINIETLDPEVDLDVCADGPVRHEVRLLLKNSFGFGGINCCALFRHPEAA